MVERLLEEEERAGGGRGGEKSILVEEVKEISMGGRMKLEKRMEGKVEEEKDISAGETERVNAGKENTSTQEETVNKTKWKKNKEELCVKRRCESRKERK